MGKKKAVSATAEPKIMCPPKDGEGLGRPITALCCNSDCEHKTHIWISKDAPWFGKIAECPKCGSDMSHDGQINIVINARGAGAHSGTIGDRKKRQMRERSDRLSKTQWDNMEPVKLPEGRKPRNPTPGGPLDPKSKFAKKKTQSTRFLPTASKSKK